MYKLQAINRESSGDPRQDVQWGGCRVRDTGAAENEKPAVEHGGPLL